MGLAKILILLQDDGHLDRVDLADHGARAVHQVFAAVGADDLQGGIQTLLPTRLDARAEICDPAARPNPGAHPPGRRARLSEQPWI